MVLKVLGVCSILIGCVADESDLSEHGAFAASDCEPPWIHVIGDLNRVGPKGENISRYASVLLKAGFKIPPTVLILRMW